MASSATTPNAGGGTFRSLRTRNYRLFFWGQLISITGTWAQGTGQSWLVLKQLKGGGSEIGLLGAATFMPILLFGSWCGVLADRSDKRKLLIKVLAFQAAVAGVQAAVVLTGVVRFWMVLVLGFLLGCGSAVEMPTRQAFVSEMVPPEDFANAVGLNSGVFNGGRVVGPMIAAALITLIGTGGCFAFNSVSFLAVIYGLWLMRPAELFSSNRVARGKGQIREGFRYIMGSPVLRSVLLLVAIVGTLSLNFNVVTPVLAKESFHGNQNLVAVFSAVTGIGSLLGSLLAARRKAPTGGVIVISAFGLGLAMSAVAAAPTKLLACVGLAAMGVSFITFMLTCNATLQLSSEPHMRGRVMAIYGVVFAGTTPIGNPVVGFAIEHINLRAGWVIGAVGAFIAAAIGLVALRRGILEAAMPEPMQAGQVPVVEAQRESAGATAVVAGD